MNLRLPTLEQLRQVYQTHMKEAFPPEELKPLSAIERMWSEGLYKPYCLYDDVGTDPIGAAFLWLGRPGWALLDYLYVCSALRNEGIGGKLFHLVQQAEPDTIIFGEAEVPTYSANPTAAERRLGFYQRNGQRFAGYEAEIFGVRYSVFYPAERAISDEEVIQEHRFVYSNSFSAEKYNQHIRIPCDL